METKSILRPVGRYVARRVGRDTMLVPVARGVADLESVYTLNETAARLWQLFCEGRSVGSAADEIAREFEVTLEEALRDASGLAKDLLEARIVEECEAG